MIGALLSAALGAGGLAMQAGANSGAQDLAWRNFYLQQRMGDENLRLAKATRTDALGNSVEYVPGVGFVTKPTPMTRALLNSIQHANLQRNKVDAPIRRKQLIANAERRGKEGDASHDALLQYRYGPRESEGSFMSDFEDMALRGYNQSADDTANTLSKNAVRTGNYTALDRIQKNASKARGEALIDALMQAKTRGRAAFGEQEGRRAQTLAQALQLSQSAGQMDSTPMGDSNAVERLAGDRDSMSGAMSSAIKSSAAMQGGALNNLSELTMRGGSSLADALSKIGASLGGLSFNGGGGGGGSVDSSSTTFAGDSALRRPPPGYYGNERLESYKYGDRYGANMGAF